MTSLSEPLNFIEMKNPKKKELKGQIAIAVGLYLEISKNLGLQVTLEAELEQIAQKWQVPSINQSKTAD